MQVSNNELLYLSLQTTMMTTSLEINHKVKSPQSQVIKVTNQDQVLHLAKNLSLFNKWFGAVLILIGFSQECSNKSQAQIFTAT